MYIHEPLNEPLLSPSKTNDRSDSGCLCINIHILYVDYVCVHTIFTETIYPPNLQEDQMSTKEPPVLKKNDFTHLYYMHQLLSTIDHYQSLSITISTINHYESKIYPVNHYISC